MGKPFLRTVTAYLLFFALAVKCTYAIQISFYAGQNYVDYVDGRSVDDQFCQQLDKRISFNSVKLDTCFLLYSKPGCIEPDPADCTEHGCTEYSYRVDKDTPQFQPDDTLAPWNTSRNVYSFRLCDQYGYAGPFLSVDIYDHPMYQGSLQQQWRDVCTCQNVPNMPSRLSTFSIRNYYNDMVIFSEENCKGRKDLLPAGDNLATLYTVFHNPKFNVASFRPRFLPDCIHYTGLITGFYFKIGTSKQPVIQKILLGSLGHIVNDVDADATTQQFPLSKTVTQTVNFSIATGYTYMDSVNTDFGANISGEAEVPLVLDPRIWEGISADYQYPNPDSNTTTFTVSTQRSVQRAQEITVPACHTCALNAFVNQAVNFPIKYASYANVQAVLKDERMNSTELKSNLPPGFDYVKVADNFTVVAVTFGTMNAQFGLDVFVETDCKPIPNCPPNNISPETIGTSMGEKDNWNSLSESSFPF